VGLAEQIIIGIKRGGFSTKHIEFTAGEIEIKKSNVTKLVLEESYEF